MSKTGIPKAETNTSSGVKLAAHLKRYWFIFFAISVFSATFNGAFYISDMMNGRNGFVKKHITGSTADKYRALAGEWAPRVRADRWKDFLYSIERHAQTGDTESKFSAYQWGERNSKEMRWFLAEVKRHGFKAEWMYPGLDDSYDLKVSW